MPSFLAAIPSFIMAISSFVTVTGPAAMAASRADRVRGWSDGRGQIVGFPFLACSFPFLARPLDSVGGGIDRMGWQTDEAKQLSYQNDVHTLFFLVVVGD